MPKLPPTDDTITFPQLEADPYPIYKRLRAEKPVARLPNMADRIFFTKAADTKHVKDNPEIFSSNDPITPMKRAFRAHTLMRKDGEAHKRERMAMAPAYAPGVIKHTWTPIYERIARDYVGRLPRGEIVDLFPALNGPYAAAGLAHLLGIEEASDADMQRWSQILIDGAGNFSGKPELFAVTDGANDEMDALFQAKAKKLRAAPNESALSVMVNAADPIPWSQIVANIKIAIGGGINEPRDALSTVIVGLLEHPDQFEACKVGGLWVDAFEEAIRWVAPIQVSGRYVIEDTEVRGYAIPKGTSVMTIQASANRDEEIYGEAEDFDLFREKKPHQAFGNGPHFCQGTHVARKAVAEVMLPILFDRFPNMELVPDDPPVWSGFGFRGPIRLPVRLN